MHKYQRGYLCAIVGSHEYPGAAVLSTIAAARVGVGGVKAVIPTEIEGYWQQHAYPEIMRLHGQNLSVVAKALEKCQAVLIGCGLGCHDEQVDFVKRILLDVQLPCVIDADALNCLARIEEASPGFIRTHSDGSWILTPHEGELKRLLGGETPPDDLSSLAKSWQATILQKGFPTHIYSSEGEHYINKTGNDAASTAGCGDVLAGVIAGLLAQNPAEPFEAARKGMDICGKAADHLVKEGAATLLAHDIAELLPKILPKSYL